MSNLLEINDNEAEHLVWIHSNKFIIPDVFHKKFFKKSYRYACRVLRKYYLKRGFLHITKAEGTTFQDSMYFLTTAAIQSLDSKDKILVRGTKYPVKINPYERQHDLRVQEIRVAIESSEDLSDIFWVTDFEMRSGITPVIKAKFREGKLDKKIWRSNGSNPNSTGRRTPDGYFEADLEGQREGFTIEFENHPYNDQKLNRMTTYLKYYYPNATKLVVSASRENSVRMIKALQTKIKGEEQHQWFVSDFEKVKTLPFKKIWHQLNHPIKE
jgi:hypothetical protein